MARTSVSTFSLQVPSYRCWQGPGTQTWATAAKSFLLTIKAELFAVTSKATCDLAPASLPSLILHIPPSLSVLRCWQSSYCPRGPFPSNPTPPCLTGT